MSLAPELEALRDSVASVLADHGSSDKTFALLAQVGVLELELGQLAIVLEEAGKALYAGPLLSSAVAAHYVPALADGARAAGLALAQPGQQAVAAVGGVLSGTARFVLDGEGADVLLVEGTDGLYLVEDLASVAREPLRTTDLNRRLAHATFYATPAVRVDGSTAEARAIATALIACEQVGGAQAALDQAVEYAKIRSQFGRQIGSFQSIKHLAADMFVAVTSARAVARKAAEALGTGEADGVELASIAKAWCSDAYVLCGETNVQIHGGIGFTWEHTAHLHLRRAKSDEQLFGDSAFHRATLAEDLGI